MFPQICLCQKDVDNIIQIWHLGECNINFYCTQKNDIARGACAECNIIFQSAIKIDIDTKPKCHICFIICLLLIQIKYLTNLKNYAPQYQFCKVVMWPWTDQSQQRMSSRHIIKNISGHCRHEWVNPFMLTAAKKAWQVCWYISNKRLFQGEMLIRT